METAQTTQGNQDPKQEKQENKQQTQKPAVTKDQKFRTELKLFQDNIIKLCQDTGMAPEKFMVIVENSVRKNPRLLDADRRSFFASILVAAEFGLEINGPLQQCFIIPYNDKEKGILEAQFQFGYFGITHLMYRNPVITKVMSECRFSNDHFDRWIGDDMHWKFMFKPAEDNDRGAFMGAFAIVHMKDTEPEFKYMSFAELEAIRAKSKSPHMYDIKNDPQRWMYRKATVRQISKLIPKDELFGRAIAYDAAIDGGANLKLEDGKVTVINNNKPVDVKPTSEKLKTIFGKEKIEDAQQVDY